MKKLLIALFLTVTMLFFLGCTQPPVCGNGFCETGETPENCPAQNGGDCPPISLCGNGTCDAGETYQTCPEDCGQPPECRTNDDCPTICDGNITLLTNCVNGMCEEPQIHIGCKIGSCDAQCGTDADCNEGQKCDTHKCTCGLDTNGVKAVVLVDKRLYSLLKSEIDRYVELAKSRRQFGILLDNNKNLDDYAFEEVRGLIKKYKKENPYMEGALFIGNIKLPSFYSSRGDNEQIRLWPAYYESLNLQLDKFYQDNATVPPCAPDILEFSQEWCETTQPKPVPKHDFDYIKNYPAAPDIWTAYIPVGEIGANSYQDFANQLKPYFSKVLKFYNRQYAPNEKMYELSSDLFGGDLNWWQMYSPITKMDFYAMNPDKKDQNLPYIGCCRRLPEEGCDKCRRPISECLVRAPLENYSNFEAFKKDYDSRAGMDTDCWMGDGSIYIEHMQQNSYEFVLVNQHSYGGYSVISSEQAKNLTNGGMIMIGEGCSVAEFRQPNSSSYVDSGFTAADNILLSYIYGSSNFLAAMGSPFNRGHSSQPEILIDAMKNNGDYLGKAHFKRMQRLYVLATNAYEQKEQMNEMLLGDPFLDTESSLSN
ncbi:MAG: C25 family cysteine peptidase [Candidatus Diapherotrites archaeon]|nr:C25 family cysteine peptidase [Candidatus Diapherotrites archaeon]